MQQSGKLTREQRMTPYQRMLLEQRMKTQQPTGPYQTPGTAAINTNPVRVQRPTTRPDRSNTFPHLCYSEPVQAFRPEAVAYMAIL